MLKFTVLITAIWLLLLSSCFTMPSTMSKRGNVQICGRMLAQTLNLVCGGKYYDPEEQNNSVSKKDVSQQMQDEYDYSPGWYLGSPLLRAGKMSYYHHGYPRQSPPSRREASGVVDECCKKACPVTVLMSYCQSPQ